MSKSLLQKAEHIVRNHPANKELMELGFGCEIKSKKDNDLNNYKCTFYAFTEDETIQFDVHGIDGNGQYAWVKNDDLHQTGWDDGNLIILGKPAHLEHYLRVLFEEKGDSHHYHLNMDGYLVHRKWPKFEVEDEEVILTFNLTTGKPATEKDAEEYIKLVTK